MYQIVTYMQLGLAVSLDTKTMAGMLKLTVPPAFLASLFLLLSSIDGKSYIAVKYSDVAHP